MAYAYYYFSLNGLLNCYDNENKENIRGTRTKSEIIMREDLKKVLGFVPSNRYSERKAVFKVLEAIENKEMVNYKAKPTFEDFCSCTFDEVYNLSGITLAEIKHIESLKKPDRLKALSKYYTTTDNGKTVSIQRQDIPSATVIYRKDYRKECKDGLVRIYI